MNKHFTRCLKRLAPLGLAASAAVVLLVPAVANATPYVLKLVQQGSDVGASGSGAFDLTGLTLFNIEVVQGNALGPDIGFVAIGTDGAIVDGYTGLSGPTFFGSGGPSPTYTTTGTGDTVALVPIGLPIVYMPQGYVSGNPLANSSTWYNASFASLGVTPGTYAWTWGTGADQSFTLDIVSASVPEPAALGMFGFGVLLIGTFVGLRRRAA